MERDTRRKLEMLRDQLYLAGEDMLQAAAGLQLLQRTEIAWSDLVDDDMYARMALWSGIVVSYCRPFTNSNHYKPTLVPIFGPDDDALAALHDDLMVMRHSYIAHTDSPGRSGRHVEVWPGTPAVGAGHTAYEDDQPPLMADLIEAQRLSLKARFLTAASDARRTTFFVTDATGMVHPVEGHRFDERLDVVRFFDEARPGSPVAEFPRANVAGIERELEEGSDVVVISRDDPAYGRRGIVTAVAPALLAEVDGEPERAFDSRALGHFSRNRLGRPGYPIEFNPSARPRSSPPL